MAMLCVFLEGESTQIFLSLNTLVSSFYITPTQISSLCAIHRYPYFAMTGSKITDKSKIITHTHINKYYNAKIKTTQLTKLCHITVF